MPLIRSDILRFAGWAFLLAALVHLDWHLGRPLEMRLSLAWPLHWLTGLAAGAAMAWMFLKRFEPSAAWRRLVLVGVLGFVLGQFVEPALEVVAFGVTFEQVYPWVRWRLFFEFAAAWGAGCAAVLVRSALWRSRRPALGRSADEPLSGSL